MKPLIVKDNTKYRKDDFSPIPKVTQRVVDKTLAQLEKEGIFVFPEVINESEDLSKDQIILQSVNDVFQTGNVMGYLGCGQERLIIGSRFSDGEKDYFFQYLLDRVLDFPNIVDMETDEDQDNKLFNLLLFLFPYYLRSAMRKGLFKTYVRMKYNDGNVRGSIDVNRHVKDNTPFTGNVAYSQREYSYDNLMMELVRHTIEYIKGKPYGNRILARAKDEVKLVVAATPNYQSDHRRKVLNENRKNPVRHAFFREYRALQHLCILILRHQRHQIGLGTRQIYGVLFDGAWLWEEYINVLIKDWFYHPMNKGGEGAQRLFEGNIGLIYPDFISRDIENRVIADAKYKPSNNIGNQDYLQLLAYMFRFDAKQGFYFYPESNGESELYLRLNCGTTYEKNVRAREDIQIVKYGLKIPEKEDNYGGFVARMQRREKELQKIVSK